MNAAAEFDLHRFVSAQSGGVYETALAEIRAGRKTSHWMWFVFPQMRGLGFSSTAQFYGIVSLDEARAYLADPVLGARLRESAGVASHAPASSAVALLGSIDAQKLRSSMTLFHEASPSTAVFGEVLARWFDGEPDEATLRLL